MSRLLRGCRVLLSSTKTIAAAAAEKPKRKAGGALTKEVKVSQPLASFLGVSQCSRPEVVKKIWAHIKLHNLQDPGNKREINCDPKLKSLFEGRERVNMLEIGKLLNPHFIKTA